MSSEVLKLTAQIVISHASTSELTPKQLVEEIKEVYHLLSSLTSGAAIPEPVPATPPEVKEVEVAKKPVVPLHEIVQDKYVICLECGKKMRTLKAHLRKTHNLSPADYYRRYSLDPKKFPLVCKEYSDQRRKMAKEKGLGEKGFGRKSAAQ